VNRVEDPPDLAHCNHSTSCAARRPPRPGRVSRKPTPGTVAKLIETTKCIGCCKACQVACMDGKTCATRSAKRRRIYDNRAICPASPGRDALHRYENPKGDWNGLIARTALHALCRPGVPESVPGAGRDRAVLERHRWTSRGELIGCGGTASPVPVRIRASPSAITRLQVPSVLRRVAVGSSRPASSMSNGRGGVRHKEDMQSMPRAGGKTLIVTRFEQAGLLRSTGVGGTPVIGRQQPINRSVRARACLIRQSARWSDSGRVPASRSRSPRHGSPPSPAFPLRAIRAQRDR